MDKVSKKNVRIWTSSEIKTSHLKLYTFPLVTSLLLLKSLKLRVVHFFNFYFNIINTLNFTIIKFCWK